MSTHAHQTPHRTARFEAVDALRAALEHASLGTVRTMDICGVVDAIITAAVAKIMEIDIVDINAVVDATISKLRGEEK